MKRSHQSDIVVPSLEDVGSTTTTTITPEKNPFYIDELRSLLLSLSVIRGVFHTYSALLCVSHRFYAATSELIASHFDRPLLDGNDDCNLLLSKKELAYHYRGTALVLRNFSTQYAVIDNDTLSRLTQLTSLDLTYNNRIAAETLVHLTRLRHLNLDNNKCVNDWSLMLLTGLTSLSLFNNYHIHSYALLCLPALTSLVLRKSEGIRNHDLVQMTRLRRLALCMEGGWVLSDTVARLTALEELDLQSNDTVRGDALVKLTRLHTLNLKSNEMVHDYWLGQLTQLTSLCLDANDMVTDAGLSHLTGLRVLSLANNMLYDDGQEKKSSGITTRSLQQLTSLRDLSLYNVNGSYDDATDSYKKFKIASTVVHCLTNLERLDLTASVTDIELWHLTQLQRMRLVYVSGDAMLCQVNQFMTDWSSLDSLCRITHDEVDCVLEWERYV